MLVFKVIVTLNERLLIIVKYCKRLLCHKCQSTQLTRDFCTYFYFEIKIVGLCCSITIGYGIKIEKNDVQSFVSMTYMKK